MISKILPEGSKAKQLLRRWLLSPRVPPHILQRYIPLNGSQLQTLAESLRRNFFSQSPPGWLTTELGKQDFQLHLVGRLEEDRRYAIPWLDHAKRLDGSKILEIGCGTGSSTVALAEQGANVVAIDIDELALTDAKKRCELHGLHVDFVKCNATEIAERFSQERFDFIIYWACMEHLTIEERLRSIADTWRMLPSGGLWCITDTPNRLWFHDFHTAFLPFFMWLPDELAIAYARFSPRQRFKERFSETKGIEPNGDDLTLRLARWGRGASFHEFALAIGPPETLDVVSCMEVFNRKQRLLARLKWLLSESHRYETFLTKSGGKVHRGFFQENLDLIVRKP